MSDMAALMMQNLLHFANSFKYLFLISLISYLYCPVESSGAKINLPVWISRRSSVFIIYCIKIKSLALVFPDAALWLNLYLICSWNLSRQDILKYDLK